MKVKSFGLVVVILCTLFFSLGNHVVNADTPPAGYPTGDDYMVFKNTHNLWTALVIDCDEFEWNGYTCGTNHTYPVVMTRSRFLPAPIMGVPVGWDWATEYVYYNGEWKPYSQLPSSIQRYSNEFYKDDTVENDVYVTTLNLVYHGILDYSPNYGDLNITENPTMLYESSTTPYDLPLIFPFGNYTPYDAPVSSVMDHFMTTPYTKDGIVLAFNGEVGAVNNGCWCYTTNSVCNSSNYTECSVVGFMNLENTDFLVNILNYDESNPKYLYYDGHPGYDYPTPTGTDLFAPTDGILCVATDVHGQSPPTGGGLWRKDEICPLPAVNGTTWSGYHTFYIIHEDYYMNGSFDDYMVVFLHSSNLESLIQTAIENYGYVEVYQNDQIADSGDYGSSGAYHVHFEVYKKIDGEWELVDPYGYGINDTLWINYSPQ